MWLSTSTWETTLPCQRCRMPQTPQERTLQKQVQEQRRRGWRANIILNKQEIEFKIDTGADVTVIPKSSYTQARDGPLTTASEPLNGPSQQRVDIRGQFLGTLKGKNIETKQDIYVVHGLQTPLLGQPAIEALGVATQIENVHVTAQFPTLFQGLGRLKENYRIQLRSDAKPFALTTPRQVAVPLLPKIKAELERMEEMGVIS